MTLELDSEEDISPSLASLMICFVSERYWRCTARLGEEVVLFSSVFLFFHGAIDRDPSYVYHRGGLPLLFSGKTFPAVSFVTVIADRVAARPHPQRSESQSCKAPLLKF